MLFIVKAIVDGDTFKVSPNWSFDNQTGDTVRPVGYNTPEFGQPGYFEAKERLRNLILGKDVDLQDPIKITYGRLLCTVYVNGVNLAEYFQEYAKVY